MNLSPVTAQTIYPQNLWITLCTGCKVQCISSLFRPSPGTCHCAKLDSVKVVPVVVDTTSLSGALNASLQQGALKIGSQ